jgi:hypothetical protein
MKTTLDLPDDLLAEAKAVAARRRITLKAMVTHALRREIMPSEDLPDELREICDLNELGLPVLKKRGNSMTMEQVQHLIDHQYDEEDARVIEIAGGMR